MTIGIFLRRSGDLYENFTFEVRGEGGVKPVHLRSGRSSRSSMVFGALIFLLGWTGARTRR